MSPIFEEVAVVRNMQNSVVFRQVLGDSSGLAPPQLLPLVKLIGQSKFLIPRHQACHISKFYKHMRLELNSVLVPSFLVPIL